MLRITFLRRIGVESDIVFRSLSKDRAFMQSRLQQVGNQKYITPPAESAAIAAALAAANEDQQNKAGINTSNINDKKNEESIAESGGGVGDDTFSRKMTQQELNRFTSSLGSKENLHNFRAKTEPGLVVDEETGLVEGQNYPDPTRYGDWEYNGRCYDF